MNPWEWAVAIIGLMVVFTLLAARFCGFNDPPPDVENHCRIPPRPRSLTPWWLRRRRR